MRHLNWLSHTQEHYRKYSIAELRNVREDATAAARNLNLKGRMK